MAKKKAKLQGRIRYVEDWNKQGEHYLFEIKWSDEEEWGLEIACKLWSDEPYGGKGEYCMLHYTALTKIREWQRLGVEFWFM